MSDCDGCEIDLAEALSRGTHDGGVLASEVSTHNFLLHSVRQPFAAPKLLLPRLADAMDGDGAPAFSAAAFHEWSVVERRSTAESSASDWSLEGFEARRSELGVGLDDVDLEDP